MLHFVYTVSSCVSEHVILLENLAEGVGGFHLSNYIDRKYSVETAILGQIVDNSLSQSWVT